MSMDGANKCGKKGFKYARDVKLLLLQSECLLTFCRFRYHVFRGSMLARRALRSAGRTFLSFTRSSK